MDHSKTIEDAKKKLPEIAHVLKKPRSLVHVSETPKGVEGEVEVTVIDNDPFQEKRHWVAPTSPGESIVLPIDFAVYDIQQPGHIYLAGKNGSSSEHFLTMGMPGTGKSKVWQAIYGTVLSRKEVSVVYGDPAKGMQTGGPLASGLDWFAWTEEDCKSQIKAIMDAIPARTNYLTSRGLSHWQSGCGLNFLVFHLEEASRFAEISDLILLLEAARSAGIAVVISLQRASHDRIPTSARYNLGGSLCFGVKGKRDTEFILSEYARDSGAAPHIWQNRFPGRFYLESTGIDQRLAGHPLQAYWIDDTLLEKAVDEAASIRTPMDQITVAALGEAYANYRRLVDTGRSDWQTMRANRGFVDDTPTPGTFTAPEDGEQWDSSVTQEVDKVVATVTPNNLFTNPEETKLVNDEFIAILKDWADNGKTTFINKEILEVFTKRKSGWVSKKLHAMKNLGMLDKTEEGFWRIIKL